MEQTAPKAPPQPLTPEGRRICDGRQEERDEAELKKPTSTEAYVAAWCRINRLKR